MKRLLVFGLSLGLVAVLAAPAAANNAQTYDFFAGQDEDIGDITIKTVGGPALAVTIDITAPGWCMTEVHIDQATSEKGLDQNKAGNPQVGKFEVSDKLSGCDTSFGPRTLSGPGPYVAVHAKVRETIAPAGSYATKVVNSYQGVQKDLGPIATDRSDPDTGLAKGGDFFSLGFKGEPGEPLAPPGGVIIVNFGCRVLDASGDDLGIWEVTNGSYPVEKAKVEVSLDLDNWTPLGPTTQQNGRSDFNVGEPFQFVKLTDWTDPGLFDRRPNADGFDLDGVETLNKCVKWASAWGADGAAGTLPFGGGSWATYINYVAN